MKNPYNTKATMEKMRKSSDNSMYNKNSNMYDKNTTFKVPVKKKDEFVSDKIEQYKNTKGKILNSGTDNAGNKWFEVENKQKQFGKDRYFVSESPERVEIYKVKKNLSPYSKFKNSKLVYSLNSIPDSYEVKDNKKYIDWRENK